jgi:hypothetical protein
VVTTQLKIGYRSTPHTRTITPLKSGDYEKRSRHKLNLR